MKTGLSWLKAFSIGKKGQIFSVDAIAAVSVFLFILLITISYSTEVSNKISEVETDNSRYDAALAAANSIVYSYGEPSNWENLQLSGVSAIGLAKSRNEIDNAKLMRLADLNAANYNEVKEILGLEKYGLKIDVEELQNGQGIAEFGVEPESESKVSVVRRIAVHENENVLVIVKVFE